MAEREITTSAALTSSGWLHGVIVLGCGVLLTMPAFWSGFVIGHDSLSHLIMSRHFVDQLWAGDWYPRWLAGMNAGLGSPVAHFYGPVPYYITALFRPLVANDPEGWHQLGLAAALAVIASGFTAYAWLGRLGNRTAALMGAVLYMSAPYHLAVDLYQRFAFAELWGFVWMPLVMLCSRAAMRGGAGALTGLAVSYALLILTHLPTTLLFSWIPLAYAAWMAERGDRLRSLMWLAGALMLGIGLSAFYFVPAMTTQQYVLFENMQSGRLYFGNNFLFHGPRVAESAEDFLNSLGIGVGGMVLTALAAGLLGHRVAAGQTRREGIFWMAISGAAFFMMLYPSKPVWDLLPVIQMVQFPWRFTIALTVAMSALVVLWTGTMEKPLSRANPAPALIVALVVFYQALPTLAGYLLIQRWTSMPSLDRLIAEVGGQDAKAHALLEAAKLSRYNSFLPKTTNPALFANTPEAVMAMSELAANPAKAHIMEGRGSVSVQRWAPPQVDLAVNAETSVRISLQQLYYPGWAARIEGSAKSLVVEASRPDGLIEVLVPPGVHAVRVGREPLPQEQTGRLVTTASLALLVGFLIWSKGRPKLQMMPSEPVT